MAATDKVVPVVADAQKAYDAAVGLAIAWRAFAEALAGEMGEDVCTHPEDLLIVMNEHRSACGLCGRQFVN